MNELQRTKEWHLARQGKITASECYLLLKNHKEQMSDEEIALWKANNPKSKATTKEMPFSEATFTWLDKKIAEYYMTRDSYLEYIDLSQPHSKALDWGETFEDDARERYCLDYGKEIADAPFIPMNMGDYHKFAGGSPDGIDASDNSIIEIKCPFNPAVHLRHFLLEKPEDLKEYNEQYYAQCQYNMLMVELDTGKDCPRCTFISYDPRVSVDVQIKTLVIPKDDGYQADLIIRTRCAIEYYKQRMEAIQRNKQQTTTQQ